MMSAPTEYQAIFHDGKPAFVLVPPEDFERLRPMDARRPLALQPNPSSGLSTPCPPRLSTWV